MLTVKNIRFVNICLLLFSCSAGDKRKESREIISVQEYGDTMRLEIEKRGDKLIKHFIDLEKDDGFDNTYDVESMYERRNVDSTIVINNQQIFIQAVLTENYSTVFSSGKIFYFITSENDTISFSGSGDVIR